MSQFDLIVIGGGPGGYTAAIRASQLGLMAACIDTEPRLGGTCLRIGCIPSKALLESSEKFAETKSKLSEHGVKVADVQLDLATMLSRKEQIVDTLTKGVDALFRKHKITRYTRIRSPRRRWQSGSHCDRRWQTTTRRKIHHPCTRQQARDVTGN